MIVYNGVHIKSQRQISIDYFVDAFLRRHYGPGIDKAPDDAEIEGWCEKQTGHLHRPVRREIVRTIKVKMDAAYPGRKK